ncbi:MAG TPA: NUDIX domain-containing protein [Puia sp.]|nr:NUDIX domain-containing protein [Puia sp.]
MTSLFTSGLVILKKRKLLLAFSRNKQAWYLPGGKRMEGETAEEALLRKIQQELDLTLDPQSLRHYMHISAKAFGEKKDVVMEQECFCYGGELAPRAGAEIEALQFFDRDDYRREPRQVPGVLLLLEQLKKDGLID